jgi:hypothetical protein
MIKALLLLFLADLDLCILLWLGFSHLLRNCVESSNFPVFVHAREHSCIDGAVCFRENEEILSFCEKTVLEDFGESDRPSGEEMAHA